MRVEAQAGMNSDTTVHIKPPRVVEDTSGARMVIPWQITWDLYRHSCLRLDVDTRADLVRLRDAITDALDAHPET